MYACTEEHLRSNDVRFPMLFPRAVEQRDRSEQERKRARLRGALPIHHISLPVLDKSSFRRTFVCVRTSLSSYREERDDEVPSARDNYARGIN